MKNLTLIFDAAGRTTTRWLACAAAGLASILIPLAAAAQNNAPIVYPSQGQTMQQQSQDEAQCRGWAQQNTGFNPYQGPPQYSSGSSGGGALGGAARGAALGAIGGAIAGDAGKGAAIGAGIGGVGGLMRRGRQKASADQANQQAMAQYNQGLANFNRAFATCVQGRGYAVN